MRIPNPIATTTTEAYLAYKAEVLAQADLKEKLYHPYLHIDGWLAYWTGLTDTYPTDSNGDPECLTDEEAYIANLAGVKDDYPEALKDPADVRVASYLRYLISARFGRPAYPVTREELYLSMLKPAVVPSGDPSSYVQLEGTAKAPFILLEMYGDATQKTYSGKNLLNPFVRYDQGSTQTLSGVSVTFNDDQSITFNGTMNSNNVELTGAANVLNIPIDGSKSYYAYIKVLGGSVNVSGGRLAYECRYDDGASVNYRDEGYNGSSQLIPLRTSDTQYITRLRFYNGSSATTPTVFNNWRIQIGVYAEEYADFEPYVGGTPSPSPDYPQPVQTVTGRQVVSVTGGGGESAEYEINLGSIELCKLSDTVQDYIYKNKDSWYLHKEVGKRTYDSSSAGDWFRSGQSTSSVFVAVRRVAGDGVHDIDASTTVDGERVDRHSYNTHFTRPSSDSLGTKAGTWQFNWGVGRTYVEYLMCKFSTTQVSSVAEAIAWFSAHSIDVYYPEKTPTDTEITNAALIGQLNALVEGGSYEGQTTIAVTATDPNLPVLLKVEAAKYA